ncbi:MAG: oligosaccharide flippase family protein [Bacilli bacterium]
MKNNIRTNVIVNLIRTIVLTILSFITFPFVCRILGDSYLGMYTWANTFVYYFLILAKISIPNIAVRECVKVRDNKELLTKKAHEFFIIQSVMTVLSFVLMLTLVLSIPNLHDYKDGVNYGTLIFLLSINFLAGVFSFEWIYIALEKHLYIAIRSIVILAISAILIFSFLKYPEQVYIYALISVGVTVVTVLSNIIYLPKHLSKKYTGRLEFRPYIKPILLLFFVSVVLTLYNETDIFILGLIDESKAQVGSYSVGIKGIEIIITIITSLSAVFMPRATHYYEMENKTFFNNLTKYSMNICFFIAVPAIATMCTMSDAITGLISGSSIGESQYQDAWVMLTIFGLMMLTYSIGDIIYSQVLIPMKREKIYLYTMLIGVVLNIGLSILFGLVIFKDKPGIGVALATIISDFLILVYLLVKTRKYTSKAVFNLNNLKIIIFGLAIGIFSAFMGPIFRNLALSYCSLMESYVIELVAVVFIDAVIYIVGLLLTKEKLVSSFLKKKKPTDQIIKQ